MTDRCRTHRAGRLRGGPRSIVWCCPIIATQGLAVTGVLDGVGLGAASRYGSWPGREVAQ